MSFVFVPALALEAVQSDDFGVHLAGKIAYFNA